MQTVIICGDSGRKSLTSAIYSACSNYGGAVLFSEKKIIQSRLAPAFCIFSVRRTDEIKLSGGIVVFGIAIEKGSNTEIDDSCICILDSGNSEAVNILKKNRCKAVGCSISGKDTLTASVNNSGKYLICLTRSIMHENNKIDPGEYYVNSSAPTYPVLAASGVLLLSGIEREEYFF